MGDVRPVIAVAEMWQAERLAEINWMFTSNEDVDKDTKSMVTFRDELPCHLQPMKGIVACKAALRADQKLYEVVDMLHSLRKRSRTGNWPAFETGLRQSPELLLNYCLGIIFSTCL